MNNAMIAFLMLKNKWTWLKAAETTIGGDNAIEFDKSTASGNNEVFFEASLKNITPGVYEWLRLSLAYQNYDVKYYVDTVIAGIAIKQEFNGTVASFIGFNTYLKNYKIKDQTIAVNANKSRVIGDLKLLQRLMVSAIRLQ